MASAISPPDPTGSRASSNSPDEIPSFKSDLSTARKELQQIATHLNVLMVAYNRAHGSPLSRHEQVVDRIGGKLLTSLAFYRNSARKLAIHCRTAQESQQSANSCPSAAYSKLQRMRSELELLRVAVGKLVPQDYSVFNDLKLVSVEGGEEIKTGPLCRRASLFRDGSPSSDVLCADWVRARAEEEGYAGNWWAGQEEEESAGRCKSAEFFDCHREFN